MDHAAAPAVGSREPTGDADGCVCGLTYVREKHIYQYLAQARESDSTVVQTESLTYHGIHDAQGTGIRRARRARSALRLSRRLVELLDSTMAPRIWNARGVPVSRAAARWVLHTHEELVVSSGARVPGEALRGSSSFTEEDAPPPAPLGSSLRSSPCGAARAASAWEGVSTGASSAGSERAARLADDQGPAP